MMQFYKSQFEAAQQRIAVYEREAKKMKRELAHTQEIVHQQHMLNRDLEETNEQLTVERDYAEDQYDTILQDLHINELELENKSILLKKTEDRMINLMTAVQKHFADHPELPEEAHQPFIDAMGPTYTIDISDDETEPDEDIPEIILEEPEHTMEQY